MERRRGRSSRTTSSLPREFPFCESRTINPSSAPPQNGAVTSTLSRLGHYTLLMSESHKHPERAGCVWIVFSPQLLIQPGHPEPLPHSHCPLQEDKNLWFLLSSLWGGLTNSQISRPDPSPCPNPRTEMTLLSEMSWNHRVEVPTDQKKKHRRSGNWPKISQLVQNQGWVRTGVSGLSRHMKPLPTPSFSPARSPAVPSITILPGGEAHSHLHLSPCLVSPSYHQDQ